MSLAGRPQPPRHARCSGSSSDSAAWGGDTVAMDEMEHSRYDPVAPRCDPPCGGSGAGGRSDVAADGDRDHEALDEERGEPERLGPVADVVGRLGQPHSAVDYVAREHACGKASGGE